MKKWKKRSLALLLVIVCIMPTISCAAPGKTDVQVDEQMNKGENKPMEENKKEDIHSVAVQLTKAQYPEMAKYPEPDGSMAEEAYQDAYQAWRTSVAARIPKDEEYKNGIREFYEITMQEFLQDTEGKNKVYSPLNVYMALAMLAETTDGNSRQQILDLLGAKSIEELRNNAGILWNANYCDDGTVTSLLASSVWLNDTVDYNADTLQTLADNYYASSFSGTMGSAEYNKMLQDWLNEQTGGLLEEQASNIQMDPFTVLGLATTVYFRAKWANEFNEANNTEEIFHTPSGEVTAEFMHQSRSDMYYWGENFSAISRRLKNSGEMLLILPDEDVTAESLLYDQEVLDFLQAGYSWENNKFLIVNQSVPKFDVVSDYSIIEGLKKLGITDVFDGVKSDFSPLTTDTEVAVNKATHAARVMIDEEGCIAAAFTVMNAATAARPPEEQVDFVLDRPFLFVIKGQDGQPLFIGIVNQPKQ